VNEDLATVAMRFTTAHPLAGLAREQCTQLHRQPPRGTVACGACWEHVIRTDAVFADRWGLPAEPVADPDLVDEIAVERACTGDPVALTAAEVAAAVARMRAAGLGFAVIGQRLRRDPAGLRQLLHPVADEDATGVAGVAA
jgi:hypothetical protein